MRKLLYVLLIILTVISCKKEKEDTSAPDQSKAIIGKWNMEYDKQWWHSDINTQTYNMVWEFTQTGNFIESTKDNDFEYKNYYNKYEVKPGIIRLFHSADKTLGYLDLEIKELTNTRFKYYYKGHLLFDKEGIEAQEMAFNKAK